MKPVHNYPKLHTGLGEKHSFFSSEQKMLHFSPLLNLMQKFRIHLLSTHWPPDPPQVAPIIPFLKRMEGEALIH